MAVKKSGAWGRVQESDGALDLQAAREGVSGSRLGCFFVWLSRAFQDLSNGSGCVVIRVRWHENRGWQQVRSARNQLLSSIGNRISDGGGWAVPETAEAAE